MSKQLQSNILQSEALQSAFKDAKAPKIVRVVGDLNTVEADGMKFYRHDRLRIPNMGNVLCASYDNQFIFRDTRKLGWTLFCTCGSPAVVVGYNAYAKDASAGPEMLVCFTHASHNKHADGST